MAVARVEANEPAAVGVAAPSMRRPPLDAFLGPFQPQPGPFGWRCGSVADRQGFLEDGVGPANVFQPVRIGRRGQQVHADFGKEV